MGTRKKEQKEQVNSKRCCACFRLRTAVLLTICTSILLILAYGYEYWTHASLRDTAPLKFYGYVSVAGIEFVLSVLGWIAVYNHIRSVTKFFTYWIIVHLVIIAVVFWVSTLFDYLHYAFFIAWIVVQIVLIALLWKYKQVLKMVYGWGDDAEAEEEEQAEEAADANGQTQAIEAAPIKPASPVAVQQQNKSSNASVNVSINLTMPQQQPPQPMQPQPMIYAQPQPMMPMQSAYGQVIPPQPMQSQYPRVQSNSVAQSHRGSNAQAAPAAMNSLSDIAQGADLPNEESQGNETDEEVQDMYKTPSPGRAPETYQGAGGTRYTVGNDDDEGYGGGEGAEEIAATDTDMDVLGLGPVTNAPPMTQEVQQRPRMKTPDPPPPPNQNQVQLMSASMEDDDDDDNDVLHDDFVADIEPNPPVQAETKGVNLYFLDPGDNATKGAAFGHEPEY